MKRTSPYFGLKWLVEVKWPSSFGFEVISAYNHDRVAREYADSCFKAQSPIDGKPWVYRVRERQGNKWVVVHTTEKELLA